MMARAFTLVSVLVAATGGQALPAAETWRSSPLDTYTLPFTDGKTRFVVEWGSQAPTMDRDPEGVHGEYVQLVAWFGSPEVSARIAADQAHLASEEATTALQQTQALNQRYATQAQHCDLPASGARPPRAIPLPTWLTSIPADLRPLVRIGIFDAAEPTQVRWALAARALHQDMQLFAVGWSSVKALDQLNLEHPGLSTQVITRTASPRCVEEWVADFGVRALPAFVAIDGPQLRIEEGCAP